MDYFNGGLSTVPDTETGTLAKTNNVVDLSSNQSVIGQKISHPLPHLKQLMVFLADKLFKSMM
jgi:hypothetical protein